MDLGKKIELVERVAPRWGEVRNPFEVVRVGMGNCLGIALCRYALDPKLVVIRHSIDQARVGRPASEEDGSSPRFDHFISLDTSGDEPLVIDAFGRRTTGEVVTRVGTVAEYLANWSRSLGPVLGDRFTEGSEAAIRKTLSGERDSGEGALVRARSVNPQNYLDYVTSGGEDSSFGALNDKIVAAV